MITQYLGTIAEKSQIETVLQGDSVLGHLEPRIAWVGRSNVGKSSLINALLEKRMARVSRDPGRTQAIHFFKRTDLGCILVDLPGYGYAKASKEEIQRWSKFIDAYLLADPKLVKAAVLLDARHGPTDLDAQVIHFLRGESVPVLPVFTKFDTLKNQSTRAKRAKEGRAALIKLGVDPDSALWVSVKSGIGLPALKAVIRSEGGLKS